MTGNGGLNFSPVTFTGAAGPPFAPTSADNGLSIDAVSGKIVLGSQYFPPGTAGGPETLINDRQIDMGGNRLVLIEGSSLPFIQQVNIGAQIIGIIDTFVGGSATLNPVGLVIIDPSTTGSNLSAQTFQIIDSATLQNAVLRKTDITFSDPSPFTAALTAFNLTITDVSIGRFSQLTEQALFIDNPLTGDNTLVQDSTIIQTTGSTGQITTVNGTIVKSGGTVQTQQPSINGSGLWNLGKIINGAVVLNAGAFIEVKVDGVVKKLLIAT